MRRRPRSSSRNWAGRRPRHAPGRSAPHAPSASRRGRLVSPARTPSPTGRFRRARATLQELPTLFSMSVSHSICELRQRRIGRGGLRQPPGSCSGVCGLMSLQFTRRGGEERGAGRFACVCAPGIRESVPHRKRLEPRSCRGSLHYLVIGAGGRWSRAGLIRVTSFRLWTMEVMRWELSHDTRGGQLASRHGCCTEQIRIVIPGPVRRCDWQRRGEIDEASRAKSDAGCSRVPARRSGDAGIRVAHLHHDQ